MSHYRTSLCIMFWSVGDKEDIDDSQTRISLRGIKCLNTAYLNRPVINDFSLTLIEVSTIILLVYCRTVIDYQYCEK